jgi:hypothetical protein
MKNCLPSNKDLYLIQAKLVGGLIVSCEVRGERDARDIRDVRAYHIFQIQWGLYDNLTIIVSVR